MNAKTPQQQARELAELVVRLIGEKYEQVHMTGSCTCYSNPDNVCPSCAAFTRVEKQSVNTILRELNLEQLIADKERLDWLEKDRNCDRLYAHYEVDERGTDEGFYFTDSYGAGDIHKSLRTAIDSAMFAQGKE